MSNVKSRTCSAVAKKTGTVSHLRKVNIIPGLHIKSSDSAAHTCLSSLEFGGLKGARPGSLRSLLSCWQQALTLQADFAALSQDCHSFR